MEKSSNKSLQYNIKQYSVNGGVRFRLEDSSGAIIDDAQGYGYKTIQSASKTGWYKFKDGKKAVDHLKVAADKFARKHPNIVDDIHYIICNGLKGDHLESEVDDEIVKLLQENNLKLPIGSFRYL